VNSALADASQSNYRRVWFQLSQFCTSMKQPEWATPPLSVSTVFLFFADGFSKNLKGSTLTSMSSALSYVHKLRGLPDPTTAFIIQKFLQGACKLTASVDIRYPITRPILKLLVNSASCCLSDKYNTLLFQTAFVLAFHGFFRIGELFPNSYKLSPQVVQVTDVSVQEEVAIQLNHFRNKRSLANKPVVVRCQRQSESPCPVTLVKDFLRQRGTHPGPLFADPAGNPILRAELDRNLKIILSFAGLDSTHFKGHSFRIGACTEAANKGLSDSQIRSLGRWSSNAFKKYIRPDHHF
jgi:hypothetical protein